MNRLPPAFVERMSRQLQDEMPAFVRAMEEPAFRGIRMNPAKPFEGMDAFTRAERVPWCPEGYILPEESKAGSTIFHEAGAFYLQEPSAMLPAEVMDVHPGDKILDLCSAPGGKATQMALRLQGEGIIICNEPVFKRASVLSRNLERIGIMNSIVTCCFPEQLPAAWQEMFDGVMVDAPCSGEGMFRRDPDARDEWSAERALGCAVRQHDILSLSAAFVRPGGRLVYSTCTFNPEENEETVRMFLQEHPEFSPEPFSLPGAEGKDGMFLCMPHRQKGEGQFTAKMRKRGHGACEIFSKIPYQKPTKEELTAFREQFPWLPVPNAKSGNRLFLCPPCPELKGIRILRAGLNLAEILGKTIVPDHAAALCSRPFKTPEVILSREEAQRYLAGAEVQADTRGWTSVVFAGLRLGWGKGSGGTIKNHYPKGLRRENIIVLPDP